MKKILVGISVVLVALVIFGAGFLFAQSQTVSAAALPQFLGFRGMMGGRGAGGGGQVHEYVEQALADKLGMTKADLETQLFNGKSMYQVALDKGIADKDVPALLGEVHKTGLDKAVKDGLLTQAQADGMLATMQANGYNSANNTMEGPGYRGGGQRGAGMMGGGRGGMMGGGRGNQAPQTAPQATPQTTP